MRQAIFLRASKRSAPLGYGRRRPSANLRGRRPSARALRGDLIDPAIAAHHGRIVKRTGDGSIIEFRSAVDAVRCATEIQNAMIERNAGVPPGQRIEFRVGVHVGDVVEEADADLMGDGVRIALKRQLSLAISGWSNSHEKIWSTFGCTSPRAAAVCT